ncbi:MAG: hypothetical protein ACD_22C00135G0002 [uncultured bacterium]|uniref:Thioredoxin domain-containing protein n=1 Tax=candidate division WWE3 bacterium RBG_16_37_10 TaxID=1802610 RepID=A0A1F4UVQ2_UNCKA|nr:MAG: hypothetical protein ACD_22C00135G0002 [uncultured bacterium]OGC49031.1 MAG: hypothetical protein A2W32_04080 [candidate division WWE3 bacterium RBG_16_37_10]
MIKINETFKNQIVSSFKGNFVIALFISLITVLAFFVGSLSTKVSMYQDGVLSANTKNAENTDTAKVKPDLAKPSDKDHTYGNKNANVALVVYTDFTCPYCRTFHETATAFIDQSQDKVKLVIRHFPLAQLHPNAWKQAQASECVFKQLGDEKFFEYIEKVFTATGKGNVDSASLKTLASEMSGIDQTAFDSCLDNDDTKGVITADYQTGQKAGVNGTPGDFLYNVKTGDITKLGGNVGAEALKAASDAIAK